MNTLVSLLLILAGVLLLALFATKVTQRAQKAFHPDAMLVYFTISLVIDLAMLVAAIVWDS
jgi:hypothetical protein